MADNRRKPREVAVWGVCNLCDAEVLAGDGIRLTTAEGHWTLWHPRCAVRAAGELHEAGTRALARGGADPGAAIDERDALAR